MNQSNQEKQYDVIVVGLGCVGMSSAYQLSKNGYKVLGLEKHSDTGSIGTSSYGLTRIWRISHDDYRYNDM
jgi:sarcosine oxidase